MIDLRALFYGLAGAGRLVRLDISGAHIMVGGLRGFWSSLYGAAGLVAPLYILLIALRFDPEKSDGLRYLIVHGEMYIVAWLAFPFLMQRICGFIDRSAQYLTFIIAYNWLSCLYNVMYLLVGLAQASGMIDWETASSISVGLIFASLVWIGHLVIKTLHLPLSVTIGILVLDLFLGIIISMMTSIMVITGGLTTPAG